MKTFSFLAAALILSTTVMTATVIVPLGSSGIIA